MKAWILYLSCLLTTAAWADVTIYSSIPSEIIIQCGEGETRLNSREFTNIAAGNITVLDEQSRQIFQGTLSDRHTYVLCPGSQGQAKLLEAGANHNGGKEPLKAIGFFNATGIPIILEMFSISTEDNLTEVKIEPNTVVGPYELATATYKVFVKDEGGNPIGTSYNNVQPGRFYLLYRRRPTLYDIESLGTILPGARP